MDTPDKTPLVDEGRGRWTWPKCRGILAVGGMVALVIGAVAILLVVLIQMNGRQTLVETTCGPIEGIYDFHENAFSFKGIPYAAPPIGSLRWKRPVPLKRATEDKQSPDSCWTGTHQADTYGTECPQIDPITHNFAGSEDCLFLNVFSPTLGPSVKLPVMVYLHGGYLLFSNASTKGYAPSEKLARDLNTVFVSIQYRLNGLGFLVLEELGKDQAGNYGLWDQIEGLRWVRDNIKNFGGDPEKVTIFGQSSGGTSVWGLLASPIAKGLFHRVWTASGSPVMNKSLADAAFANRFFLENTGCDSEACLRNLTAEQVVNGVNPQWEFALNDSGDLPIKGSYELALIVIDGKLFPKPPFEMFDSKTGEYSDVPLMIGTTAQEVDFMPAPGEAIKTWTHEQYLSYVKSHLDTFGENITNQVLELYNSVLSGGDPEYNFTTLTSDLRMNCGNDVLAEKASRALSSGVYRYIATSKPSSSVHPFGIPFAAKYAFHSWDVFAFFDSMADFMEKMPEASDRQFSSLMRKNVMSFAVHGVPTDSRWLPFSNVTALISDSMDYTPRYHEQQCDFWKENGFFAYSWIN